MDITLSQIFGIVISVAIGVIGWFVKRIFDEIEEVTERSRANERDLYVKLSQTREEMLKMEIDRLRSMK